MLRIVSLIVALGTTVALPVHAATQTLLVRLEERAFATDRQDQSEILVYRDGEVLFRHEATRGGDPVPILRFVRGLASEEQMSALAAALGQNRVGFQVGGCFVQSEAVHVYLLQQQVDWYGKGSRHNSFVTDTRFATECGSEVYAILRAIREVFAHAAVVDDRTTPDLIEDTD